MKDSKVYNWFVRNNVGYKLLALLLAFTLWYYVAGQRDPIIKRNFMCPVVTRGLASEQLVVSSLPEVRVTVRGMRSIMQSVKREDIKAYVEITGQEGGERYLPVQIEVPFGVQVTGAKPERIKIDLDVWGEKKVPVKVLVRGETAPGFTYQNPSTDPDQITIKGPSRLLAEVQDVQAVIELKGARDDITQQVQVQLPKDLGNKITIQPDSVQVQLPVVTKGPVKTVAVTASLQGEPGEGFVIKTSRVEPDSIKITGSAGMLANLQEVQTRPVDLSGAEGNITKEVELALPEGVVSLAQNKVKVTVEIIRTEEEQLSNQ